MSDHRELQRRVAAALPPHVSVLGLAPITGGACQENFRVELSVEGVPTPMALRSDARTSLPGSIGRTVEYALIRAAHGAGVPTPAARWLTPNLVREGAAAYFMDWVDGEAIGARVARHPTLAEARAILPSQLGEGLARIHRITPATHPDLPIDRAPFTASADPAEATLGFVRTMIDSLPSRRPAFELAYRWLAENKPAPQPVTLVHADFRTGNFMVRPDGLAAILDWEFGHWGDPIEDIGYLCVRDWRFGVVDQPAGGLCDRATFCRAYTAAGGQAVDPDRLHFWEVCGNIRWGVAAALQGERYARGEPDFELLAIPRRANEMEYEMLRLIEVGPPSL